jgi:hypothetical protein
MFIKALVLGSFLLHANLSLAATVACSDVFKKERNSSAHVENIVSNGLQSYDLQFANGKVFKVLRALGEGSVTTVFEAQEMAKGKPHGPLVALRVPRVYSDPLWDERSVTFLDLFINGYQTLFASGIRVPKIYSYEYGQYAAVELIKSDLGGADFFRGINANEDVLARAEAAFYRFADSISGFQEIGDFRTDQIVYVEKTDEWVLIDWSDGHLKYDAISNRPSKGTPFEVGFVPSLLVNGSLPDRGLKIVRNAMARIRELRTQN